MSPHPVFKNIELYAVTAGQEACAPVCKSVGSLISSLVVHTVV